jgi:hypothetical protein
MSTEYTISSKVIECGSNGRTIPFFFPWLDSVTESPLLELSERQCKKKCSATKQYDKLLHVCFHE